MRKKRTIALILLLIAGVGILLYPAVSGAVNRLHGSYAIQTLRQELGSSDAEQLAQERKRAEAYNKALLSGEKPENYGEILNFANGMMGYIQIPKIHVNLPIYHGVSEEVLAKGVGHMPESAFPTGGEGNHAVLTGHTGLPSAKLFTDLTELETGDLFYVSILDQTLAYAVDRIRVVLPSEGQDLMPEPGKDFCTLVTCTPYGVNSHRLLVRGQRVELTEDVIRPIQEEKDRFPWGMVLVLLTPVALFGFFRRKGR